MLLYLFHFYAFPYLISINFDKQNSADDIDINQIESIEVWRKRIFQNLPDA